MLCFCLFRVWFTFWPRTAYLCSKNSEFSLIVTPQYLKMKKKKQIISLVYSIITSTIARQNIPYSTAYISILYTVQIETNLSITGAYIDAFPVVHVVRCAPARSLKKIKISEKANHCVINIIIVVVRTV